jgi:hypothetical protein
MCRASSRAHSSSEYIKPGVAIWQSVMW